jgi:hypothetical protein
VNSDETHINSRRRDEDAVGRFIVGLYSSVCDPQHPLVRVWLTGMELGRDSRLETHDHPRPIEILASVRKTVYQIA